MAVNPLNLLLTLVGGLILAGLTAWIRRQRLVLFVPRLFSYSALAAKNGQLAELSVMNRGFKTEEQIEVNMSPTLQYEVVGSTNNDVTLSGNKLLIPRVGAGDDVTTILLVEGGAFSASEISNCLSKESKGIIVGKLEQVPMTGPQRVSAVAILVVIPAFLCLGYFGISGYFDEQIKTVGAVATEQATASATESATASAIAATTGNTTVHDWNVPKLYTHLKGPLVEAFKEGKIQLNVGTVARKNDISTIPTTITNTSEYALKVTLSMDSQQSEGRIPSYQRRLSDILVVPGATVTKSINVVIPHKPSGPEDQKVYIQAFVQEAGGDSLNLLRTITVQ
ncbi:hypothetical protein [Burkholderia metallica]|uniref:hypothetical protein n=1 Tax=Burkholderia metallica TaxID=488729 RepID=UPI001CF3530F|nr:hypothetical protein [Burkholderia metallica]MCA8021247.1 hypothetical protein [Burkholderia metallica]